MMDININNFNLIDIQNECKSRRGLCRFGYNVEKQCKYKEPICDKMKARTLSGFDAPRDWRFDSALEQDGGAE